MPGLSDTVDTSVLDAAPPASAPAAAPAPAEPPSLRETLEAAVKANPIDGAPSDRDTPTERADQQTQRVRDGQGRFQKKNADGSEVPSEEQVRKAALDKSLSLDPNEQDDQDDEQAGQQAKEEVLPSTDNAPRSWKGPAKDKWATVDPVVRAEIHRRERDAQRLAQESAPVKKFTQDFTAVINPFAQHYAQSGLQPLQLFQNLMSADVHLSTAPPAQRAQFMAKLIKDYQIDIGMLDSALAGEGINDPNEGISRLLDERLAPVNEFLQTEAQRRQATVQAEARRAETVLDRMARDTINFPHFDLVAQDMADITEMALKRRVYLTPQEAYARAVAMNPEAQAAEQSKAGQQRAQVAHDAATRSLGASLSVSGSPASLKQEVNASDLRGTIEAAWNAAQGR